MLENIDLVCIDDLFSFNSTFNCYLSQEHRVLLSGTPLQNNVNELFSLLNFLEPTQFSSSEAFLQEFGALKTETEVQKLQLILKPMMLRRLKEDVEKSIAPKEETVVEASNFFSVFLYLHIMMFQHWRSHVVA
jgi:hypothetical protein